MRKLGLALIVLGAAGILLPAFGLQSRLVLLAALPLGNWGWIVPLAMLVVGITLLFLAPGRPPAIEPRDSSFAGSGGEARQPAPLQSTLDASIPPVEEIHKYLDMPPSTIAKLHPYLGEMRKELATLRATKRDPLLLQTGQKYVDRAGVDLGDVLSFLTVVGDASFYAERKQWRDSQAPSHPSPAGPEGEELTQ